MAIRLVSGKPGAGKSFYCVQMIAKLFCKKIKKEYYLNDDVELITNIDGLKLDHVPLSMAMDGMSVEDFFSNDHQVKLHQKAKDRGKKIVYAIDECQQFFHKRFYNRDVFLFFEMHRHYEMDIILCAHTTKKVCGDIMDLVELNIGAVPRSIQMGSFCYNHRSNGETVKREFLKRKKEIFDLYKSSSGKESINIKSPVFRWAAMALIVFGAGFWFFKVAFLDDALAGVENSSDQIQDISGKNRGSAKYPVGENGKKEIKFKRIENVVVYGEEISVVDPETGLLMDVFELEYPIRIKVKNGRVRVYGKYIEPVRVHSGPSRSVLLGNEG